MLDLHGHTTSNGSFIYGNTYDNVFRYERHLVFPKLLSANAPDFASEHMMFNADERKNGSLRRFCCETLADTVNAYTLEISMGGYKLKGTQTIVQYIEEDCMLPFVILIFFSSIFSNFLNFPHNIHHIASMLTHSPPPLFNRSPIRKKHRSNIAAILSFHQRPKHPNGKRSQSEKAT